MSDALPLKESSSEQLTSSKSISKDVVESNLQNNMSSNAEENKETNLEDSTSSKVSSTAVNGNTFDFVSPPWKSCWDPNYHCYYYWNTETNETTYTLPGSETTNASDSTEKGTQQSEVTETAQTSTLNALTQPTSSYYPQDMSNYYYMQQNGGSAAAVPYNYYPSYAGFYAPSAPVQHSTEDPEYSEFIRNEYGVTTITSEGKVGVMFNATTGNLQSDQTITPDKFSQYNKAVRQCNAFFDYDAFVEQRGLQYMAYYNGLAANPKHQKLPKKIFEKLKSLKKEKKLEAKKKWLRD